MGDDRPAGDQSDSFSLLLRELQFAVARDGFDAVN
jgi:hypothetical protein